MQTKTPRLFLVNLFLTKLVRISGFSSLFSAIAVFLYPPTNVLKTLRACFTRPSGPFVSPKEGYRSLDQLAVKIGNHNAGITLTLINNIMTPFLATLSAPSARQCRLCAPNCKSLAIRNRRIQITESSPQSLSWAAQIADPNHAICDLNLCSYRR